MSIYCKDEGEQECKTDVTEKEDPADLWYFIFSSLHRLASNCDKESYWIDEYLDAL